MDKFTDKLHIWITGGTIDSEERKGERAREKRKVKMLDEPLTPALIEDIKTELSKDNKNLPEITTERHKVYKDSDEVTNKDLFDIAHSIVASGAKYHVVTHGTDTMVDNAKKLNTCIKELAGPDNDIVVLFTGAMTPLANGAKSDGFANMRFSIETIVNSIKNNKAKIEPGVYIAFDGELSPHDKVYKDFDSGKFLPIDTKIIEQSKTAVEVVKAINAPA